MLFRPYCQYFNIFWMHVLAGFLAVLLFSHQHYWKERQNQTELRHILILSFIRKIYWNFLWSLTCIELIFQIHYFQIFWNMCIYVCITFSLLLFCISCSVTSYDLTWRCFQIKLCSSNSSSGRSSSSSRRHGWLVCC